MNADGTSARGPASIEQLHERHSVLSRDVGELAGDLRATQKEMATSSEVRRVENSVASLASKVEASIADLSAKFDAAERRRQPNIIGLISVGISAVIAAVTIMSGIFSLAMGSTNATIAQLNATTKDLQTALGGLATLRYVDTKMEAEARLRDAIKEVREKQVADIVEKFGSVVTKEAFVEAMKGRDITRDQRSIRVDSEIARLRSEIDRMMADVVPRKEHDREWAAEVQHFGDAEGRIDRFRTDLQRQVDDLAGKLNGLYSPRDEFARLQQRLDELERKLGPKS